MTSPPASVSAFERHRAAASNTVFKSGPLFISSKGIGWKSWKKRWFILTRTSLVFFRNDPSALPQRGGEVNLTLGGIDLNNSGSVVVREDKKLLTVLFPDGRDGRAFTLKAETLEDLFEWKTALEQALAQAPNAALVIGHNGIFRNDNGDTFEGSVQQWRDKRPIKSLVVGRPILLALEDIDGAPSFLEKALRFLEEHGRSVEGILRQSADVEEVDRRIQEYEQGRTDFSADEDAHVVGDCVKHVLRELPSSPVPASCCTALLDAYRMESEEARVTAIRSAISDTFPEPNRGYCKVCPAINEWAINPAKVTVSVLISIVYAWILKMMHTVAAHTSENRMTPSAVAACMAPLLLRPLLAGECELEDDFDLNGDGSAQLLAAANAATNAQAIITVLLEEYDNILDDDNLRRSSLSPDSQIEDSGSEESFNDRNIDVKENGYHDAENHVHSEPGDDRVMSGKLSESSGYAGSDLYDYKAFAGDDSDVELPRENQSAVTKVDLHGSSNHNLSVNGSPTKIPENRLFDDAPITSPINDSPLSMGEILSSFDPGISFPLPGAEYGMDRGQSKTNGSRAPLKRSNFWGRDNVRKNQPVESVDSSGEEELAIRRLEMTKNDLKLRIAKEAKGNAILQASLERRKQALHERRLALEQDVSRLQEQLQAEKELRATLEVDLSMSSGQFSSSRSMDSKTRAELEEIALAEADVARLKQKVAELHVQLNQQSQHYGPLSLVSDRYQHLQTRLTQQKVVQQDFDMSLAFCNNAKKKKNEESVAGADWRYTSGKQLTLKQSLDTNLSGSKDMKASTSVSSEVSSFMANNMPKALEGVDYLRQPSVASSTLVELTTRLDFFKERRSQLMEQLHSLHLNHGNVTQGLAYKSSPT